ncbi:MAG: hypothetical protein JWM68_3078 [Verrucomicrobiales bacterium]|nr:hypothetical protein [Verrucomicrobiales bacterium]
MRPFSKSLKFCIGIIGVSIIAFTLDTLLPPASERKLAFLIRGTTSTQEVEDIFGKPQRVRGDGTRQAWRYSPRFCMGYLDVFFDASGRLVDYNYERF